MLNSNQDGRRLVDANTHYELHIQCYQEKPERYTSLIQAQTKGSLISFDGYDVAIIKGGKIVTFYEGNK